MKILVLGANGMLGHQLVESLGPRHEVIGTFQGGAEAYLQVGACLPDRAIHHLDVRDDSALSRAITGVMPAAVVNAVGIVKQRTESKDVVASLEVNALLPHRLAQLCKGIGARLIHFSTDCIFSGKKGMYCESDFADADDLYGRSKFLGEVADAGCVTLRTSIVGLELSHKSSLVEWFLAQRGPIRGYRNAVFTGFITAEMSRLVERILVDHPGLHGVYQIGSDPIDKYTLLRKLRDRLGLMIDIVPDEDFRCDRSLVSERLRHEMAYAPPDWDRMIDELAVQIERREASRTKGH